MKYSPFNYSWPLNSTGVMGTNSLCCWKSVHNIAGPPATWLFHYPRFHPHSTTNCGWCSVSYSYWKKSACKWTCAVHTHVVRGSTILVVHHQGIGSLILLPRQTEASFRVAISFWLVKNYISIVLIFFFFFFAFCFLGPHPQHMEVPRLGVKSELQLPAYTSATAMQDLSQVCDLHYGSWQHQILNPQSKARDWTHNLMVPPGFISTVPQWKLLSPLFMWVW